MNASGPSRPKVSYFCVGNTQFFSFRWKSQVFCRYNDVLVLFHLYGRINSKCIHLQNSKKESSPPPSTLMTSIGSVDFISIEYGEEMFPFSLLPPPPPPSPAVDPRYSFLHLVFMEIQIFYPDNVFTIHSESSHFFMRTFIRYANTPITDT